MKAKKILIMESGSFKNIGGAAKDSYRLYEALTEEYSVDLFGDFSRVGSSKPVTKERFLGTRYDLIIMNSIRDVLFVNRYGPTHNDTRYIYVDRGGVMLNAPNPLHKKLLPKSLLRQSLLRSMSKWLDCYVAISPLEYEIAPKFLKRARVEYIPIAQHKEFRKLNIKKDFRGGICVGRLDERQKRLSFLIEGISVVIAENPSLKSRELLRIIGEGRDGDRYRSLVKKLEIERNVKFPGYMSGESLVKAYNNSGFLVSTSEWESYGRNFLEAMACGIPLLINDRINTVVSYKPRKETIVTDGYNGLIYRYGDKADFAKKFALLYTNSTLRSKLAKNAHDYSFKFSFDKVVERYTSIIDSL